MSTVLENKFAEDRWASYDYDELVSTFATIAESKMFGSYQGDILYFLTNDKGEIGWLVVGYGSCTGCDALEAATSSYAGGGYEEVCALRDELERDVQWFSSIDALREWVDQRVSGNDWYWTETEDGYGAGKTLRDWAKERIATLETPPSGQDGEQVDA
jgi:hypothetical protein